MEGSLHETDVLLASSVADDRAAVTDLLIGQQMALTIFVSMRLGTRLAARIDVGDVVQDVFVEAVRRLPDYVRRRAVPFVVWLQHIALDCLSHTHRTHIRTKSRSVCLEARRREVARTGQDRFLVSLTHSHEIAPSAGFDAREFCERIGELFRALPQRDQDLLQLRIVERRPVKQVALTLGMTVNTVRNRQFRALQWLRARLDGPSEDKTR